MYTRCTLVFSYVNYGILVWGSACKTYLEKLFSHPKWAVRTISNSHHSEPLFYKYKILNIHDAYKLKVGVFMYKYFIDIYQSCLMISLQSDLTFVTITHEIIVITTKPGTKKYLLINDHLKNVNSIKQLKKTKKKQKQKKNLQKFINLN